MAFKFRYESLLKYRRHLKEIAQLELARSMEHLALAREGLDTLSAEYNSAVGRLNTNLKRGMVAQRLQNHVEYLDRLKRDIAQKAMEVAEWEQAVENKRAALIEKDRDLKIIDKLKSRDFEKWVAEEEAKEQKALNEMAVLRHGRDFQ